MPKFVCGFLEQPLLKDHAIGGKSVKLLTETMRRDERTTPLQLRFAKNERENRNIQIHKGDAKNSSSLRRPPLNHVRKNFCRQILLASHIEGETGIGLGRKYIAAHKKLKAQTVTEFRQKFSRNRTERQKLNEVHSADAASRFQPYFLSLLCSVTRSISRTSAVSV